MAEGEWGECVWAWVGGICWFLGVEFFTCLPAPVPPASPSCHLLGVPRVGTNVTLSCQSPRSKPAAQYQWEWAPPSSQVFFAPVLGEGT